MGRCSALYILFLSVIRRVSCLKIANFHSVCLLGYMMHPQPQLGGVAVFPCIHRGLAIPQTARLTASPFLPMPAPRFLASGLRAGENNVPSLQKFSISLRICISANTPSFYCINQEKSAWLLWMW